VNLQREVSGAEFLCWFLALIVGLAVLILSAV